MCLRIDTVVLPSPQEKEAALDFPSLPSRPQTLWAIGASRSDPLFESTVDVKASGSGGTRAFIHKPFV